MLLEIVAFDLIVGRRRELCFETGQLRNEKLRPDFIAVRLECMFRLLLDASDLRRATCIGFAKSKAASCQTSKMGVVIRDCFDLAVALLFRTPTSSLRDLHGRDAEKVEGRRASWFKGEIPWYEETSDCTYPCLVLPSMVREDEWSANSPEVVRVSKTSK